MPEDRRDDYLDDIDAAADWWPEPIDDPTPPSFPEWNRRRVAGGLPAGTFTEYLADIGGFTADDAPDDREWPAHPYEE